MPNTPFQPPVGSPPPPLGATPPPIQPKKTSPLVWIAGGCGVLILIVVIAAAVLFGMARSRIKQFSEDAEKNPALAAAKFAVALNPELEVVSSDDNAQTITIRNKKTNETVTMDLADVKAGKFRFSNEKGEQVSIEASGGEEGKGSFTMRSGEGETTIQSGQAASVPDWVPSYPGSAAAGVYSSKTDEGLAGAVTFTTGDGVEKVIEYFAKQLKGSNYEVTSSTYQQDGRTSGGMVGGNHVQTGRGIQVTVTVEEDKTQATVTYQETKPPAE